MPQTTVTEQKRIQRKTGDTVTDFPDEDIDLLFAEASELYSAYNRTVWLQAVVVMRLEERIIEHAESVTYQQNETREQLSDITKALERSLARAKQQLDDLISVQQGPAVAIGSIRRVPTRTREEPRS